MNEVLYEFKSKLTIIGRKYETHVQIYEDRAEIRREGVTGALPKEGTAFFSDMTGVSYGSRSGRTWISFIVPGTFQAQPAIIRTTNKGGISAATVNAIPYDDPFSVVSGMGARADFEQHAKRINEIYAEYKSSHSAPAAVPVVSQESAIDKLKKLKELNDLGIISDEEFAEKKQKLMAEI